MTNENTNGYLHKSQSNIQSLSLITSTACLEDEEDDMEPVLLNGFNKIRKLSWKCLRSPREYQTSRDLLRTNFALLEKFTVESGNSVPEDDEEMYHRNAVECVLVSKTDNSSPCFPPLRLLSVTEFSFTAYHGMMTSKIDFSQLRFLILQNCTDTSILLHGGLVSAPHIALKHLQLKKFSGRSTYIWRFAWGWDGNLNVF